ncbi:MAG: hypothetical protein JW768_15585 [Chitinispirillaceae bacterium]|nr:hypothetical protein [Chitinispirillaceae bacterium]
MAQMPRSSFSTDRLTDMGRTLICLCIRAGNGAERFSEVPGQALEDLEKKHLEMDKQRFNAGMSREIVLQCNGDVDDAVKDVYAACEKHDREHWNEPVIDKVFPDRTVSEIVYAGRDEEMRLVRELISRIKGLESSNNVSGMAADLEARLEAAIASEAELTAGIIAFEEAKTQERMAREQFVRAYRESFLRACLEIGKKNANRLFPKLQGGSKLSPSTATEKGETTPDEGK